MIANDSAKKEIVLPNGKIPVIVGDAKGNIKSHYLHYHDCLEIDIVTGGTGLNCIDDKQYDVGPGEIYVINNYERHFAVNQNNLGMKYILFDLSFVFNEPQNGIDFTKVFYRRQKKIVPSNEIWQNILNNCSDAQNELNRKEQGYELYVKAALMKILVELNRASELSAGIAPQNVVAYNKIDRSIEEIRNNYSEELRLEYLANLSCMSRNYFCTYFKNVMGVNVSSYIERIRIYNACAALITRDVDITTLCYECGYKSQTSFNTAFKKQTGLSPREYRKKYSGT